MPESRRRYPSHLLEELGEMSLRGETEGIGYFLNRMRGGRKLALYLLHDVFIDDCLRRLAGDAAGNLSQITATHIQLVGIEMNIAVSAAEVIHLRDKLVVSSELLPCRLLWRTSSTLMKSRAIANAYSIFLP